MKVKLLIVLLLISMIGFSTQKDTCDGVFQVVIYKGDTISVNCDRMVLMNTETFAQYYHDSKQLEELRNKVPKWVETIDSLKIAHDKNRLELDSINFIRREQVLLERESKEEVIGELIDVENKNAAFIRKNKRLRVFSGVSSSLSLILLLILL